MFDYEMLGNSKQPDEKLACPDCNIYTNVKMVREF